MLLSHNIQTLCLNCNYRLLYWNLWEMMRNKVIHYNGFGFYCMAAVMGVQYIVFVDVRFLWLFLQHRKIMYANDKVHNEAAEAKHCRFLEQL